MGRYTGNAILSVYVSTYDHLCTHNHVWSYQWSLCVTCGAWLAVQAWDSLLYHRLDQSAVRSTLVQGFIPIFRGIASFFLDYMVVLQSSDNRTFAHTGPTTSPENSYEIKFTDSGRLPPISTYQETDKTGKQISPAPMFSLRKTPESAAIYCNHPGAQPRYRYLHIAAGQHIHIQITLLVVALPMLLLLLVDINQYDFT